MSIVTRRVSSVPVRTSVETWSAIIALLTAPEHAARVTLAAISSIAAMLISEEYTRDAPIVVIPATGPRVRVYTVHGTAAIDTDDEADSPLATWPMADRGWRLSLPCGVDDIDDVRDALQPYPGIEVRDLIEGIAVDTTAAAPRAAGPLSINYGEMERP